MAAQVNPTERRAGGKFRALSHRNFRLFWIGAFLSNTGTWMQTVAQGLLVLQLTDSPFWLGLDGFMATAPGMVLTLLGGAFADLVDRKRMLIYTQVGAGVSALILTVLVGTGVVHVWMILVLSFLTGSCMSLAGPSYQAITIDLVGREDLANAIALNSTQFQLSRVAGPVLAGLAIKAFGLAGCFLANGLSYVAIVAALALVRFDGTGNGAAAHSVRDRRALWQDLLEGFRYVKTRPRVRVLLSISAVTSLFGAPYLTMVPVFARDVLGRGETGVSLMMGAAGAGAFCGALVLTFMGNFRRKGLSVLVGAFLFSVCIFGFSLATRPIISLTMLFGSGFSIVFCVAVINMLLQELVTNEMRGRVMSMFILSFIGAMPIGNLIVGIAAKHYGAPHTLAVAAFIMAVYVVAVAIQSERLRTL